MRFRFLPTIMRETADPPGGGGNPSPAVVPDDPVEIDGKLREPTRYERSLRGRVSAAEAAAMTARTEAEARIAAALAERDTAVAKARTDGDSRLIRAELKALAVKAGIVDLGDVAGLDVSKLKLSEAGDVEGAAEFIEALKTSKPHWFADAGAGTRTGTTSQTQKAPPPAAPGGAKHARDMSDDEFNAALKAVTRR